MAKSTYKHYPASTSLLIPITYNHILIQDNLHSLRWVCDYWATPSSDIDIMLTNTTVAIFRFKPKNSNNMNMQILLQDYTLATNEEYYDMVQESYVNGQTEQARDQFLAMPLKNRKNFVFSLMLGNNYEQYSFFFDLL